MRRTGPCARSCRQPLRPRRRRDLPPLARLEARRIARPASRNWWWTWPIRARSRQRELSALRTRIARANFAIYRSPVAAEDAQLPRLLGAQLGLRRLDANWLADEDGISRIAVSDARDGPGGFIPYTDRAIRWHTDGYYHAGERRIRGMILHCVRPARARRREPRCSTTSWPTSRCATSRRACARADAAGCDDHSRALRRGGRRPRRRRPGRCSRSTADGRAAHALHRAHPFASNGRTTRPRARPSPASSAARRRAARNPARAAAGGHGPGRPQRAARAQRVRRRPRAPAAAAACALPGPGARPRRTPWRNG